LLEQSLLYLTDKNIGVGANLAPFLIGLIVFTMGTSYGINAGFGLNPARDLGPRIFTSMAGWGGTPFTAHNNWWIYPVIGQLLGGVIGGLAYELTVGIHHELDEGIEEGYSQAPTKDEPLGPSGSGGNSPRVTK